MVNHISWGTVILKWSFIINCSDCKILKKYTPALHTLRYSESFFESFTLRQYHTHTHTHTHTHIHSHTHTHMYIHTHAYTCTYAHMNIHIQAYMHRHMHSHEHTLLTFYMFTLFQLYDGAQEIHNQKKTHFEIWVSIFSQAIRM